MSKSCLALLISILFMCGCTYKEEIFNIPANDCSGTIITFSSDIRPLVQSSCAISSGCHGPGSISGPGPLTNYDQVHAASSNIKLAVESRSMPVGSSLSVDDIEKISCWIKSGAPNN